MFDTLERKIHDIRKQPEQVRVRYMWGAVAISMVFVTIIWLMSIRINFIKIRNDEKSHTVVESFQQQMQDAGMPKDQQQQPGGVSIQDLITQPQTQTPTQRPAPPQ